VSALMAIVWALKYACLMWAVLKHACLMVRALKHAEGMSLRYDEIFVAFMRK